MSWPIKVLVVSSVAPKPTGFGEITLHRHLADEPKLAVAVVPFPGVPRPVRLLRRTALRGFPEGFEALRAGRRWDASARAMAEAEKPQLILTVAAGDGCQAALRLAKKTGLPLVTFFHDWWPDLVPAWVRKQEEARFRELYQTSSIALCVSEGMRRALGHHRDARLHWPIPGPTQRGPQPTSVKDDQAGVFKICYAGNLREYAPMLQKALQVFQDHPTIRLEVRGMNPRWSKTFREEMQRKGLYHEFAPREELEHWLASADAFLVTSAFEPDMRRLMETNFPSKLLEFARFGKPLITWGPDYSTLIHWAQPAGRAWCISDGNPAELRAQVETLAASPGEQRRLAGEALNAMRHEFDPVVIQQQFLRAIQDATRAHKSSDQLQNAPSSILAAARTI